MARGSTIHKFELDIANVDDDTYEQVRTTVARHPSENEVRVVARVLAFAICFEDELAFGRGISTTEEPDLWSRELDGRVRHWIEVGQPSGKRLVRASRRAERVSVFAYGPGFDPWWNALQSDVAATGNVSVRRLPDRLVEGLAGRLARSNDWSVALSGGQLFVDAKGAGSLECELERLLGS